MFSVNLSLSESKARRTARVLHWQTGDRIQSLSAPPYVTCNDAGESVNISHDLRLPEKKHPPALWRHDATRHPFSLCLLAFDIATVLFIIATSFLPSSEIIARCVARRTDLHAVGLQDITADYAETLRHWRRRFLARSAFEEDRARDARLALHGYETVRFTWRQVTADARGVSAGSVNYGQRLCLEAFSM
jgi:hypothetical protein